MKRTTNETIEWQTNMLKTRLIRTVLNSVVKTGMYVWDKINGSSGTGLDFRTRVACVVPVGGAGREAGSQDFEFAIGPENSLIERSLALLL